MRLSFKKNIFFLINLNQTFTPFHIYYKNMDYSYNVLDLPLFLLNLPLYDILLNIYKMSFFHLDFKIIL